VSWLWRLLLAEQGLYPLFRVSTGVLNNSDTSAGHSRLAMLELIRLVHRINTLIRLGQLGTQAIHYLVYLRSTRRIEKVPRSLRHP